MRSAMYVFGACICMIHYVRRISGVLGSQAVGASYWLSNAKRQLFRILFQFPERFLIELGQRRVRVVLPPYNHQWPFIGMQLNYCNPRVHKLSIGWGWYSSIGCKASIDWCTGPTGWAQISNLKHSCISRGETWSECYLSGSEVLQAYIGYI